MPTYDIGGIPVEFPFEAYACQLAYMDAVVRSLEHGQNALLESPTGTGKTLCLLCAVLGWRRHRQQQVVEARTSWERHAAPDAPSISGGCPRIWYASRTHSQLKQVVQELKKTSYRPWSVVLGSREHFCIHSSVSRHTGASQNARCRRARDENRCTFYTNLRKGQGNRVNTSLLDIEEIVTACKGGGICPFYKCREDAKDADLLLIPYDYLINPQTRESLQVSLQNSILIFDEGHNIEKSCEAAASFELHSADLPNAIQELDDAFELLDSGECTSEEALGDVTAEQLMTHINLLKKNLLALEESIYASKLERDPTTERTMLRAPGSDILNIFGRGSKAGEGITAKDVKRVSSVIRKVIACLTFSLDTVGSSGSHLDKVQSLLAAMFKVEPVELDSNYHVLVYEEEEDKNKKGTKRKAVDFFSDLASNQVRDQKPRTLALWCFSCSVALRQLEKLGVHALIITSGTLAPIEGTVQAFGVPFPVVLTNSHVIDVKKQLWGGILSTGPDGATLDASFAQRNEPAYIRDLGRTVERLCSCVPDGILLAFHSYSQKEAVLRAWRQSGMYEEIVRNKPIFDEPRGNMEMQHMMEGYNRALAKSFQPGGPIGGAVLAAVCRGKLCEGIDFTDRQCRMAIMVGVPYPSRNDLRVILKQSFLDSRGSQGDGRAWYCREAIRAVNQTLGRVIRHRHDFGAVLLCDTRYAKDGRLSPISRGLSGWLLPEMSVLDSFNTALDGCRCFFGTASGASAPLPEPPRSAEVSGRLDQQQPLLQAQLGTAPVLAASGIGLVDVAASARSGAKGGTQLSVLSAFWKKPNNLTALQRQRPPGEAAPLAASTKDATLIHNEDFAKVVSSGPATPQKVGTSNGQLRIATSVGKRIPMPVLSESSVAASPHSGLSGAFSHLHGSRDLAKPCKQVEASSTISVAAKKWLSRAESLLPRVEIERVREQVQIMEEQADMVATGSGPKAATAEPMLLAALRCISESLLPEFCFDTPAEERNRDALVRDCASLLPKLLRPLWRTAVEKVLQDQGTARQIW